MARPRHEPTPAQRQQAELYAAVGTPHHDIAKLVGISIKTLLKHYRHELDIGKAKANAAVGGALYKNAMKGNTSAQIFWMKAQAGWREVQRFEHSGPGGAPIPTAAVTKEVTDEGSMKTYLAMVTKPPKE